MPTQEHVLRDLLAVRACPKLSKAVEAAAAECDAACLSYEQLLQVLQSLPISDYSGAFEAACRALLEAMRAGDDPAKIQALTAEVCHEVRTALDLLATAHTAPCIRRFAVVYQQHSLEPHTTGS
jgi:hypothetical protein